MPFKSYDELINMVTSNPDEARKRVLGARKKKLPIVDKNNPGYGKSPKKYKYVNSGAMQSRYKAITRRMGTTKKNVPSIPSRKQNSPVAPDHKETQERAITKRMSVARSRDETITTPTPEKKAVLKRKKVGY